jgi:predicted metal-dependent hydrolase
MPIINYIFIIGICQYLFFFAKKAPRCLEYIIVHEMVHLLERHHNKAFKDYMSEFLPEWKSIKNELNGISLHK